MLLAAAVTQSTHSSSGPPTTQIMEQSWCCKAHVRADGHSTDHSRVLFLGLHTTCTQGGWLLKQACNTHVAACESQHRCPIPSGPTECLKHMQSGTLDGNKGHGQSIKCTTGQALPAACCITDRQGDPRPHTPPSFAGNYATLSSCKRTHMQVGRNTESPKKTCKLDLVTLCKQGQSGSAGHAVMANARAKCCQQTQQRVCSTQPQ